MDTSSADNSHQLRALPSVERLVARFEQEHPDGPARPLLVAIARDVLDQARNEIRSGVRPDISTDHLLAVVNARAAARLRPTLARAINATGVILHTNLGRAPLSEAAQRAMADTAGGYATLEIDLASGRRGSRHYHTESLLTHLTGAEAGFAVNNNAAAVLLALAALAGGREVVVSRGELVEIGGSFRLPDVMAASGATLVEVGTTNRTYARDYDTAITTETALLLKVHRSNFAIAGFVHDATLEELVEIGRRRGLPVMMDLGSGCLVDLRPRGLPHEPTVQEAVRVGCDVVTFSGDKLLGGPQAGILAGTAAVIERIRAHPIARAVRIDKLGYAALAATLKQYLDPDRAWTDVPVLAMLGRPADDVRVAAESLAARLNDLAAAAWTITVIPSQAEVGGGSLPGVALPSSAIAITGPISPAQIDQRLRENSPPIIGRIANDTFLLDARTLLPGEDEVVAAAFAHLVSGQGA